MLYHNRANGGVEGSGGSYLIVEVRKRGSCYSAGLGGEKKET